MNRLKRAILPLAKPFLPIFYFPRYLKLLKKIDQCFKGSTDVYCFFPAYHTGGAEKVHLQILKALQSFKTTTIINHKSRTERHKKEFEKLSTCFIDLNVVGNYSFFEKKLTNYFAAKFNRINHPCTLFGCNSILFYRILPLLNNDLIKKVDLLHAFSPYSKDPIETKSIRHVRLIDKRIVINDKTKEDYEKQYEANGIDPVLLKRIDIIYNALDHPCGFVNKSFISPLKCLFVGRGSVEKRVYLYGKIAEESRKKNLSYEFTAVGNLGGFLPEQFKPYIETTGEISEPSLLQNIYDKHHILITTSSYEGFPFTIMESMCKGLINISTDVGGISEHLKNNENALLINGTTDAEIIQGFLKALIKLEENRELCHEISKNAIAYARLNFTAETFKERYITELINFKNRNTGVA